MEKSKLFLHIRSISSANPQDSRWISRLEHTIQEVYQNLNTDHEEVVSSIKEITSANFSTEISIEWQYICLSFYLIKSLLKNITSTDIGLSVQENKDFKQLINTIAYVGIRSKLLPNLPYYSKSVFKEKSDIYHDFNILKCTVYGLAEYIKVPVLRMAIIPEAFKEILVALYEITECPQTLPGLAKTDIPSPQIGQIHQDKLKCQVLLLRLQYNVHPNIYIRDLMCIMHRTSPAWFVTSVARSLTTSLRSKNGVEAVVATIFADHENDSKKISNSVQVFSKIIYSCKDFRDFKTNICNQLISFVKKQPDENTIAERIFAHCTKMFYISEPEICHNIFLHEIIDFYFYFGYTERTNLVDDVCKKLEITSRMLRDCILDDMVIPTLPKNILRPIINILYRFYVLTGTSRELKAIHNDLSDILVAYFDQEDVDYTELFDCLIFNMPSVEILRFRSDILVKVDKANIKLEHSEQSMNYSSSENCESLDELFKFNPKLLFKFFTYLLNCITNEDKYFCKANEELLDIEEVFTNEYFERKFCVYKLLCELAENKNVQRRLNEDPDEIVKYINSVFSKSLRLGINTLEDVNPEGYQSIFTVLIILNNLLANSSEKSLKSFITLKDTLEEMHDTVNSIEMKQLINECLNIIEGKIEPGKMFSSKRNKTELDKVIDDVCDNLISTRGHGLMSLTKLIMQKDEDVIERKHFVLNILQQNLNNDDSYIYLSVIKGLAAMAWLFPDIIIKHLCEEYSESYSKQKEDKSIVRIKIGEVLVKVTADLGEMAPKYKSVLLNAFLLGAKDDDQFVRTSALSNLGEICKVLGYKLGSVFSEILVCVHSVIFTDKSNVARRAAVHVLKQLFIGLDQEIIAFFKEEILPVYRTLKNIYNNDEDDVIRLQAQLALEELNDRMKTFVFPKPVLNDEKKIVMLN